MGKKEGNQSFTDEEWQDVCQSQWKITKSHAWKEFYGKTISRYFITPMRKAHINNGNSQCWSNCGCRAADHYHVFWDCQSYCREIHVTLQTILKTHIPPNLEY